MSRSSRGKIRKTTPHQKITPKKLVDLDKNNHFYQLFDFDFLENGFISPYESWRYCQLQHENNYHNL